MEKVKAPEKLNKHQAKTEATLRCVLDAAEEIFVRDGYERAQIETIALQAGRTKGAIYAHFRSKEDIFFALMERKGAERRDMFLRSAEGASSQRQMEIIKEIFLDALEEENWPILLLEFKLFALRNTASLQRVRELHQLLYESSGRKLFLRIGITGKKKQDKAEVGLAVLRSMPSAIVLERQFSPVLGKPGITREVFEGVFDSLLGASGKRGTASSQKTVKRSRPALSGRARSGKARSGKAGKVKKG
ncbi:TetR/AcrR family transcriptional regulator [Acidicapsa ligni]|uniref:TetR/AcrR family transcriptional regulator n=1 Tax=Acidicapsa ligni TaxID=542300 RepID=UPI0021E03B8D|nr:TetR/AcrR family transcriptional regulator [Acidicapsa ligni]